MSAFVSAASALLADANIGTDAEWRRTPGDWLPVRVALAQPSDALGMARAGAVAAVLLGDALPVPPARGDMLRISGETWKVEDAARDPLAVTWRLTLTLA